ncbi:TIGR03790 family protein [Planctomycetota bacterium]
MNRIVSCCLGLLFWQTAYATLEPNEILIIANRDILDSVRLANDYAKKRQVPAENILLLPLGKDLPDWINRGRYDKQLVQPIRNNLQYRKRSATIRCLLPVYGVPFKVNGRGVLPKQRPRVDQLKVEIDRLRNSAQQTAPSDALVQLEHELARLQGRETQAAVDSELSLVLFENYELYRWQRNLLHQNSMSPGLLTLMVSRLDGPSVDIARALIDKALHGEKHGLSGVAYLDSRGIYKSNAYGHYDQSIRDLALTLKTQTQFSLQQERTDALFAPGDCPHTALYCGWYSLKTYVDAFDFEEGAVGYHIASFEAADLRGKSSPQWCPALLRDGITATLGAVAEPYLHAFPLPNEFFRALLEGQSLVEAYYHTKPFNSWQLLLIGDPLYRPFPLKAQ